MPSYTSLLGLALPVDGETNWGAVVNNQITALLDSAVAGTTILTTDADTTFTTSTGTANQARQAVILWTATGTTTRVITAPATSKLYVVINKTGGSQSIQFKASGSSAPVTISAGSKAFLAFNGTDFVNISPVNFTNLVIEAGTTGTAPLQFTAGANLTTPLAGAQEFNGTNFFQTIDTTSGRGVSAVSQFILGISNGNITTSYPAIVATGGGTRLSLVGKGLYEYEAEVYVLKNSSGTLTWSFVFSATPGYIHAHYVGQPSAGIQTVGSATTAGIVNATGTTILLPATGTLSSGSYNHYKIKAIMSISSATTVALNVSSSAGSVDIIAGSSAKITRLPTASVGTFS